MQDLVRSLSLLAAFGSAAACATPTLDVQLTDRDKPREHTVFRVDWRAKVAPSKESLPPFNVEQTRWEPIEISSPTVAQIKGCEGCAPEVVVGGSDGVLSAFDSLGKTLWTFKAAGAFASPAAIDGVIYVGSADGKLYAISAGDGSLLWSYVCNEELGAPPVVKDGLVFVQSRSNMIFAIEAATGKWRWQYRRDSTAREFTVRGLSGPTLVGDLLVAGFSDGASVALKRTDGALVWQHVTPPSTDLEDSAGSPQTDGTRVFVANFRAGLSALSADDGHILWQKAFPTATGLRLSKGVLFASAVGKVAAFSAFDGTLLWQRNTGVMTATGISGFPGVVMFSTDGPLLFLDVRTGRELGRQFNPGRGIAAVPTVSGRDLYVLSNNGWLYGMHLF